jgi:hypothetical protein
MKAKTLSFDPQLGHQNSLFRLLIHSRLAGVPISEAHRVVDLWLQQYRPQMTREFTSPEIDRQIQRAYQLPSGVPRRRGRPPLAPQPPPITYCAQLCAHVDTLMSGFTVDELQQESPGNCGAQTRTLWNGERLVHYSHPSVFLGSLWDRAGC